uniref:hypothetical protein n=1 Tax=Alkaliphilus transvaalensis TaxID=114628 RepID=UPI00054DD62D
NNYTINRQAPKNLHTFWMYYNSDSTDHFIVEIRSQKLTSEGWLEREIHPLREIIFDSNRKLNIIGFNSDGTPIDVTVWRKGKERTDLSDTFKNQFFRGYTREQNGSIYYYYQHYQSTADGELYPTSQLLNYVPNENILDYLSRFGLHNLDDYEHRIMNP